MVNPILKSTKHLQKHLVKPLCERAETKWWQPQRQPVKVR